MSFHLNDHKSGRNISGGRLLDEFLTFIFLFYHISGRIETQKPEQQNSENREPNMPGFHNRKNSSREMPI